MKRTAWVCVRQQLRLWPAVLLCMFSVFGKALPAQESASDQLSWQGRTLISILEELNAGGLPLIYTSSLVGPDMVVASEPAAGAQLDRLAEVLQANNLALQQMDGMYLVVRAGERLDAVPESAVLLVVVSNHAQLPAGGLVTIRGQPALPEAQTFNDGFYRFTGVPPGSYQIEIAAAGCQTIDESVELKGGEVRVLNVNLTLGPAELEQLNVSASRYILFSNSQFFIDQRAIQALPDLGEDPIRSAQRLPGAAAGGLSSRSHFRGGVSSESTIYLNGLPLLDPFHIRNFHNIFSSIDARAISGVEAYTGGFPADYGDSMSGVLLLNSQRPDRPRRTELGLSVYNTSLLSSGYTENGGADWLVSARRSNIGYFLKDKHGTPDYFDVFTELGINLSDTTRLSVNGLFADDQIEVILEPDPVELERSVSSTKNLNLWLLLENQWTPDLESTTVLSYSSLNNNHDAEVNDPDQMIATVVNDLDTDVTGLRQEWSYAGWPDHLFRLGWGITHQEARYHFRGAAEYIAFYANYPGIENPTTRAVDATPGGNTYSLFLSDRWRFRSSTALELGLRWDRQTYTEPVFDDQFSPRISLWQELGSSVDMRLTWGRYYQSQAIQRLQVEDGLDTFFPSQRANHWILGLQYRSPRDYRVRVEAYIKNYDRMSPRFENLFDSLALIPELEPDRVRLNPASARARGIELTVEYHGEGEFNWWSTLTWSRAMDSINGVNERRSWDQTWALQGGLAWERGPWQVGLALNLHTGWPITGMTLGYDGEEDVYYPVPGPRNAERLNTYGSLDFRVSRDFQVSKGELSVFFEVTNLTNRNNWCCIDYDTLEEDEDEVVLDTTYYDWLPIIPAIGLLWVF